MPEPELRDALTVAELETVVASGVFRQVAEVALSSSLSITDIGRLLFGSGSTMVCTLDRTLNRGHCSGAGERGQSLVEQPMDAGVEAGAFTVDFYCALLDCVGQLLD
jgi:hypothetical protein